MEFPLNNTAQGKFDAGGMVSECGFPEKSECAKSVYSGYTISGRAFALNKNQAKIRLKGEAAVGSEECKVSGTYTIYRSRKTKIPLDSCNANLTAYYGFERKKTD